MDAKEIAAFEADLEEETLEKVRERADRDGIFRYHRETRAWISKKDREDEDSHKSDIVDVGKDANSIARQALGYARDSRSIALGALLLSAFAFAKSMGWF